MKYITKKIIVPLAVALAAAGTITGMAITNQPKKAGADSSPIVQELSNHGARLTNAENNIKDLQAKTGTPDSSANTSVPQGATVTNSDVPIASATSASDSVVADAPAPVVVTGFREIVLDADNSDCEYTYSDGTTHTFDWKRTNLQGSWQTDGGGGNGHWVKTTETHGYCDSRAVGLAKN